MTDPPSPISLQCPIPISDYPTVLMAHGGGGRLMQSLIGDLFLAAFGAPDPAQRHDGALLETGGADVVLTTDSYVVQPLFFPGGDIGSMAVYGTVNDISMCGARPRWLSAGFILEEGLEMETLWRVARSMGEAARRAGVQVVTGDTKVVERGKGDGIFINTAGVGVRETDARILPASVRPGDAILLSGDIGRHGIAVMASREGIEFENRIESDLAPLNGAVMALLEAGVAVHCLRDLTRGGLAAALCEIAEAARLSIEIEEAAIAVRDDVRGACELLGFDPAYVANEGRFVAFVDPADEARALEILCALPETAGASRIGLVSSKASASGRVVMRTPIGTTRIVDLLSGEQLPRIC